MSGTPSEHIRFQQYLRDLERVPEHSELDLVAAVLDDPDKAMAVSAVLQHLDRRAGALHDDQFATWAAHMAARVEGNDLLVRRIRDWTTLKAINGAQPTDSVALAHATNWVKRSLLAHQANPDLPGVSPKAGREGLDPLPLSSSR